MKGQRVIPVPYCKGGWRQQGRQSGAVLVLGLILLLVLTLIGVSTMQNSVFDEKMAGNAKDRNFAFQAAESALREGELWLKDNDIEPLETTTGAYGVWRLGSPGTGNWWEDAGGPWSDGDPGVTTSSGIDGVSAQPQRIIELSEYDTGQSHLGRGQTQAQSVLALYRVTTKATGGTEQAVVQLQSIYSRRY